MPVATLTQLEPFRLEPFRRAEPSIFSPFALIRPLRLPRIYFSSSTAVQARMPNP